MDSIFKNSTDFLFVYSNLPDLSKEQLMNLLLIWVNHYEDDVSLEVIIAIIDNFFMDYDIENITSQIVNVLAKASNVEKFNSEIQKHPSFLKKLLGTIFILFCN